MNEKGRRSPGRMALVLPLGTLAAVVWMLLSMPGLGIEILAYRGMYWFGVFACPVILLFSVLLLCSYPRAGYLLSAIGAFSPLLWIFMTESRSVNSWIVMNASWNDPGQFLYMRYYQLRIVSVVLMVMTFCWAATRLLPASWQLRGRPINQRTWPAIVVSLTLMALWFATSVYPYREPIIVDAVRPELSILHVRKEGITFHECRVSVYRDRTYYVVRNDRKLFHYSFGETAAHGILTQDLQDQLRAVLALPELNQTQRRAPRALRTRHGEGWYTEAGTFAIAAFTTENASPPPAALVAFFRAIEEAPLLGTKSHYAVRDICLGFCYDPKAGLGDRAENQRCAYGADGREHCY